MAGQPRPQLLDSPDDPEKGGSAQSYAQWRQALLKVELSRDAHWAADSFRRCADLLAHLVAYGLVTTAEQSAMRVEMKNAWTAAVARISQPDSILIREQDLRVPDTDHDC